MPTVQHAVSAWNQILLLSVVCFACPGLFNALMAFASGVQDPTVAYYGNAVIYVCFAMSSFLAAMTMPHCGLPCTLRIGTIGYVLYVASLWNLAVQCFSPNAVYFASAMALGVSAGFLWTAQGQMILTYAIPVTQGRYLSTFWIIFNCGAAFGGVLSFVLNFHQDTTSRSVSPTMYLVFLVLMLTGSCIAFCGIVDPSRIVKENGQPVVIQEHTPKPPSSLSQAVRYIATHRRLLCLVPLFAYSNWFYTYNSFFNVSVFNGRTGGFASAWYWLAQMLGSFCMGKFLDHLQQQQEQASHKAAAIALFVCFVSTNVMWMIGFVVQTHWFHLSYEHPLHIDLVGPEVHRFIGLLLVYMYYGWNDAICQVWIYWYMRHLTMDTTDYYASGYHAGLYKTIQAISAAIAWWIGAIQVAPSIQLLLNWMLLNVGLVGAWISIHQPASSTPETSPLLSTSPPAASKRLSSA